MSHTFISHRWNGIKPEEKILIEQLALLYGEYMVKGLQTITQDSVFACLFHQGWLNDSSLDARMECLGELEKASVFVFCITSEITDGMREEFETVFQKGGIPIKIVFGDKEIAQSFVFDEQMVNSLLQTIDTLVYVLQDGELVPYKHWQLKNMHYGNGMGGCNDDCNDLLRVYEYAHEKQETQKMHPVGSYEDAFFKYKISVIGRFAGCYQGDKVHMTIQVETKEGARLRSDVILESFQLSVDAWLHKDGRVEYVIDGVVGGEAYEFEPIWILKNMSIHASTELGSATLYRSW